MSMLLRKIKCQILLHVIVVIDYFSDKSVFVCLILQSYNIVYRDS